MTDKPDLRPATSEELIETLSFALRFKGRKPFRDAVSLMARITAEHLAGHLQRCGFQIMKGPDAVAPNASHHPGAGNAEGQEPDAP
jgi:hypothetical protein